MISIDLCNFCQQELLEEMGGSLGAVRQKGKYFYFLTSPWGTIIMNKHIQRNKENTAARPIFLRPD